MAGMSTRKAAKARRLVTGLAKEMRKGGKRGDTSEGTKVLAKAKSGRGQKPLSEREKFTAGKRVINNQAKKLTNLSSSKTPTAPSTREAISKKVGQAGRAGGLGKKVTNKVMGKSMVKAEQNNMSRNYKAVVKSEKVAKKAAKKVN